MRLSVIFALCFFAFLYFAKSFLAPIVFSIFLFYLLNPIAESLKSRWHFSRAVSSPVLIILSFAILSSLGWITLISSADIAKRLPEYTTRFRKISDFTRD